MADAEHQAKKHILMMDAVRAKKSYEKEAYKKKKNVDFVSALVSCVNEYKWGLPSCSSSKFAK